MTLRIRRACRAMAVTAVSGLVLGVALAASGGAAAADPSTKYLTIFREEAPSSVPAGTVSRYGVTPASVLWFDAWGTGNAFDAAAAKALWGQGILPHFTWEPWKTALSVSDPDQIHLQDIINGGWDSYIRSRGAEMASAGVPIMVRWGHEFDGNWYPWGIANNGNNPALYAQAFRHVHDVVVGAGATNVQWIFTFNNSPTPNESWNSAAAAYPGDAYVDWIGIDGYNWGLAPSWDPSGNHWTSFDAVFSSAYAKARSIAPKRPVMIAEVASTEDGGNKAQWITDMSTVLNSGAYPDLKSVAYFDQDKEERWSGTSSPEVQAAFTTWVTRPYMRGTGTELALVAAQYKGTTTTTTITTRATSTTTSTTTTSTTTTSTTRSTTTTTGTTGSSTGCSASYTIQSAWSGGFVSSVTLTAGTSSLTGWRVTVVLPSGTSITNLWNGVAAGGTGTVQVSNQTYNGSLSAGSSTSFGFQGSGSGSGATVSCARA